MIEETSKVIEFNSGGPFERLLLTHLKNLPEHEKKLLAVVNDTIRIAKAIAEQNFTEFTNTDVFEIYDRLVDVLPEDGELELGR